MTEWLWSPTGWLMIAGLGVLAGAICGMACAWLVLRQAKPIPEDTEGVRVVGTLRGSK